MHVSLALKNQKGVSRVFSRQWRNTVFPSLRVAQWSTLINACVMTTFYILSFTNLKSLWPWPSRLQHSPSMWKVGCTNPGCDRPKMLKKVESVSLLRRLLVSWVFGGDHNFFLYI